MPHRNRVVRRTGEEGEGSRAIETPRHQEGQERGRRPTQKVHDLLINRGLPGTAPVKAMHMDDLIKIDQWEMTPGNVDGIFSNVILLSGAQKDPRIFEYWDMKIKRGGSGET
jgi:hypothetical protein